MAVPRSFSCPLEIASQADPLHLAMPNRGFETLGLVNLTQRYLMFHH